MKKSQIRNIIRESIKELMIEQPMTGARVSLMICGGPNQGTNLLQGCVSIGGQPAQAGQKVLTHANMWNLLDGNATTTSGGGPITSQNVHVAEVSTSLTSMATGTPCNPSPQYTVNNAWTGGCVWTSQSSQTSAGSCNPSAWSNHSTWQSTFTNKVSNHPNACNFLNQRISAFHSKLQGTGGGNFQNMVNCKLDTANDLHAQNNC